MSQQMMDVFAGVIQKLEKEQLPYMVVGSIAAMVYGEPRLTNDMDLVIDIGPDKVSALAQMFSTPEFYCPPLEVLRAEAVQRGQFKLLHQPTGLKIDVMVRKQTEHAVTEFGRRRRVELWKGVAVYLASPEDVIIKKLGYYREGRSEKHLIDIRGILSQTEIDQNYLETWIAKLKLLDEWQAAQS